MHPRQSDMPPTRDGFGRPSTVDIRQSGAVLAVCCFRAAARTRAPRRQAWCGIVQLVTGVTAALVALFAVMNFGIGHT